MDGKTTQGMPKLEEQRWIIQSDTNNLFGPYLQLFVIFCSRQQRSGARGSSELWSGVSAGKSPHAGMRPKNTLTGHIHMKGLLQAGGTEPR